jgi:hypothetical protein
MSSHKERGSLIAVWLILMLLSNLATFLLYLALAIFPNAFILLLANIATWTVYSFAALSALNIVCVCFLFFWKKWGFFVMCGSAAVTLAINLYVGVGPFAVWGVAGVVITYLVLHTKWNLFDDF